MNKQALKVIKEADVSLALFAPGWVYEVLGKENFQVNDELFWIGDGLPSKDKGKFIVIFIRQFHILNQDVLVIILNQEFLQIVIISIQILIKDMAILII